MDIASISAVLATVGVLVGVAFAYLEVTKIVYTPSHTLTITYSNNK